MSENTELVNKVMNSAIKHLEDEGREVTPVSQHFTINGWFLAYKAATPCPEDDELLKALETANDRSFCTMIMIHF